jgi:hypothetical protein
MRKTTKLMGTGPKDMMTTVMPPARTGTKLWKATLRATKLMGRATKQM